MDFADRRRRLIEAHPRTVFLIPSGSSLRYLTGLDEAGLLLWLDAEDTRIYGLPTTKEDRLWGEKEGAEACAHRVNLTFADRGSLGAGLRRCGRGLHEIALPLNERRLLEEVLQSLENPYRQQGPSSLGIRDARTALGIQRRVKSSEEITCLRRAAQKTTQAHFEVLQSHLLGKTEHEVADIFENSLKRQGIRQLGYQTIVGSGQRSLLLHARAGDRKICDGELVLIDAGGCDQGYTADVTRTFPAGQSWSKLQREVYEIVLKAQCCAIEAVRPGVRLAEVHEVAKAHLREGVLEKDWFRGQEFEIEDWFPHQTSHWLGLDVHDPSPYLERDGSSVVLQTGMALTIEPGLYFNNAAPTALRGIGIRIEDDVVVTVNDREVLTKDVPKETNEVEEHRRRRSSS